MARNISNRKGTGKKTCSIIVDGETEVCYLQMLKKYEKLPRLDIYPKLPKKKKLSDQFKNVLENAKHYDKVIWIVDYDTVAKETRETKKGEKTTLQHLNEYLNKLQKKENVEVIINAPCLEFWFLLHFEKTGRYFTDCDSAADLLKTKYLKDYEKTEKYFKKRHGDIYEKLKERQVTAIEHARALGTFDMGNPNKALCEMFRLFDLLEINEKT